MSEPKKLSLLVRSLLWVLSFVLTVAVLSYQRRTGPTYPMSVKADIHGLKASAQLVRSHGGDDGATIEVKADPKLEGSVFWRRFPTQDEPTEVKMKCEGDKLTASIPHFPPAAKVEYVVKLSDGKETVPFNTKPAVLRYKAGVPTPVLIAHIICIFSGLFFGLRAMLGALVNEQAAIRRVPWAIGFMVLGGLILGPIMQKYAFGAYWTGWPVGEDLTDTKTLVGVVAWIVAWWAAVRFPVIRRVAILVAFLVMLGVYMIPHSVRGSEYNWNTQKMGTAK